MNQVHMPVGFRTNHHSLHLRIRPDRLDILHHLGVQVRCASPRSRQIMVPHVFDLNIFAPVQHGDETGGVNVSATHKGQHHRLCRGGLNGQRRQRGQRRTRVAHFLDKFASWNLRVHSHSFVACSLRLKRGLRTTLFQRSPGLNSPSSNFMESGFKRIEMFLDRPLQRPRPELRVIALDREQPPGPCRPAPK
jgi:hypothetical protein